MPIHVKLDADETTALVVRFIRDYVRAAGAEGAVLGLSGGLDSAVVAHLAVEALGADKVHAFALPSHVSSAADLDDARLVADGLGLRMHVHEIGPIVTAASAALGRTGDVPQKVVANMMARARMTLLYAEAQMRTGVVLGTGNKSELLTGYFTKYGDGGVDLLPIGDLYKTQVRTLAARLGVPARIIEKVPTAGLWAGQTDEIELGITYDLLDQVLLGLEIDLPIDRIARDVGVTADEVARIETMRRRSQHKRALAPVCKTSIRSSGSDWRDTIMGGHSARGG